MRRQRSADRDREIGGRSARGQRRTRGRGRARGRRRTPGRQRTTDRMQSTDRRPRSRPRRSRRSDRSRPRERRIGGGRRRRFVRTAAGAVVAIGASIPPAAGLAAVAAAVLGDGDGLIETAGGSDAIAVGLGSDVVVPAAASAIWTAGGEWTLLVAALLVFGGWVVSAATAVRVAARIAALRA